MCGIAGFVLDAPGRAAAELGAIAGAMADALAHRGPDDRGVWCDPPVGVALGSRRLAIQDLSPAGHQPMVSPCGRYVLAINGEVYNFRQLAGELPAEGRRGGSDTEIALLAIRAWGWQRALARFNGMFAFALWDREERRLTLVRDRLGQKPLYWARSDGALLFASELRAFRRFPGFAAELDRESAALLFRRMSIPAPYAVLRDTHKLGPGRWLQVRWREGGAPVIDEGEYWSARAVLEAGAADPWREGAAAAHEALEALLADAVSLCSIADVPLGAFLSGGIDSSLVVALLQRASTRPVRTFTIGFGDRAYDESAHAASVAAALGTEHTTVTVGERELLAIVPRLPAIYDEPLADSSQIPTVLVCELARPHVTVALTGDGGDELFGGYAHYRQYQRLLRLRALPRPLRRAATATLARLPLPARLGGGWLGLRDQGLHAGLEKLDRLLAAARTPEEVYLRLVSSWKTPPLLGVREPPTVLADPARWPALAPPLLQAMALDAVTYLPDDVLTKVDRAAMAVGLETRLPLLDHRVVELAARLPLGMRSRRGRGKLPLRAVLARHLDPRLTERPKMGFSVPLARWLRGELRDWAEDLLDERRLAEGGLWDVAAVQRVWREHLEERANWAGYLWPVLTLEAWRREWGEGPRGVRAAGEVRVAAPAA